MTTLPNVSLNDFYALVQHNPVLKNMVRQQYVATYEEFVELLYETLDCAISQLQENPQHHQSDDEDALTDKIISLLRMAGYSATHGTSGGGSKDLTVRWRNPQWSWIGEAKKYRSLADVREGFLQLTTRYRNADPLYTQGGLLAYTYRPNAAKLLSEWMSEAANVAETTEVKLENFRVEDCLTRPKLAYTSYHDHVASGLQCKIRHIAVVLYHHPEDKSARKSKKHRRNGTSSGLQEINETSPTDNSDHSAQSVKTVLADNK